MALSEAKPSLTLRGRLVEETSQVIGIEIGQSVFEVPRHSIIELHRQEGDSKFVEVTIAADARLIQRVLTPAISGFDPNRVAGACDCACECNCACNCACGGGGSIVARPAETFRNRINEAGQPGMAG